MVLFPEYYADHRGLPLEVYRFDRGRRILSHYTEDAAGPWMFVTWKGSFEGSPVGQPVFFRAFGMESDCRQGKSDDP
jgi:hypothetical protein